MVVIENATVCMCQEMIAGNISEKTLQIIINVLWGVIGFVLGLVLHKKEKKVK